jgi:hypothetical protein
MVVPRGFDAVLEGRFGKLKIDFLSFDWKDDRAIFSGLKNILTAV